jgi:hypothetical protein
LKSSVGTEIGQKVIFKSIHEKDFGEQDDNGRNYYDELIDKEVIEAERRILKINPLYQLYITDLFPYLKLISFCFKKRNKIEINNNELDEHTKTSLRK